MPKHLHAKQVTAFLDFRVWCGRGDSNPYGITTASPSSWCVCQFRHFRVRAYRDSRNETWIEYRAEPAPGQQTTETLEKHQEPAPGRRPGDEVDLMKVAPTPSIWR